MEHEKMEGMNTKTCGAWCKGKTVCTGNGCGGPYGLVVIGAAIYYIQQADGFWMGILGILKAIVWPAMLAYNLFGFLHM